MKLLLLKSSAYLLHVSFLFQQIDNATIIQRKAYALALSVILTLRVPQVINKLDDILSGDTTSSSAPNNEAIGYGGISVRDARMRQVRASVFAVDGLV
ncbi:hypothetical protein BHM03_00022222 [Ensete ventricosum]|nr:hypothetical protein BHM03_00022222 [Ensete ventricosum]